jgi:hypothetical protein
MCERERECVREREKASKGESEGEREREREGNVVNDNEVLISAKDFLKCFFQERFITRMLHLSREIKCIFPEKFITKMRRINGIYYRNARKLLHKRTSRSWDSRTSSTTTRYESERERERGRERERERERVCERGSVCARERKYASQRNIFDSVSFQRNLLHKC